MRILTVRQPWAWAIIHGGKDVENRVRNSAGNYRGPVAIHTALKRDDQGWVASGAWRLTTSMRGEPMALGEIIGIVDLVDVHDADDCWNRDQARVARLYKQDRAAFDALPDNGAGGLVGRIRQCSPWALEDDYFHMVLANPRPLADPIPYRGALGLRNLGVQDPETTARILAQIGQSA